MNSERLKALRRELSERRSTKLAQYVPYAPQKRFHDAGSWATERMLRGGNQQGKTRGAAAETAMHLTGLYPEWWIGKRFDHPIMAWAGGETGETTRNNPQRVLLGPVGEYGTGMVPSRCLGDHSFAPGTSGLLDYQRVKHISGGWSTLFFKCYAQGPLKWQGPPIDSIWLDEEPPMAIYSEAMARIIATDGIIYLTFTPLLGYSEVVRRFLLEHNPKRSDTQLQIEDALHIPPERRDEIIARIPEHEREARIRGIPTVGEGRVFPLADSAISYESMQYPDHWAWIGGIDFGWTHPTAAVKACIDRDTDTFYVVAVYRVSQKTPMMHAAALRPWGQWLPWAWPHDGLQHDKTAGVPLKVTYQEHGLNMLPERSCFADGSTSREAGVQQMLEAMETGRFRVAAHLTEWWDEFRLYRRDNGVIIAEYDDLLSATRYAWMSRRHAVPYGGKRKAPLKYPTKKVV